MVLQGFAVRQYHWPNTVCNWWLLCEIDSMPITFIICQYQLRLYGYMAWFLASDPAHCVVSIRDYPEWRRLRWWLQLEQVDWSWEDVLGMGRGPAWRHVWAKPRAVAKEWAEQRAPGIYFVWLTDWSLRVRTHSSAKKAPSILPWLWCNVLLPYLLKRQEAILATLGIAVQTKNLSFPPDLAPIIFSDTDFATWSSHFL